MARLSTDEYMAAAEFRSALRSFQRVAEQAARRAGLTPQRHLLLLMIRGSADGSGSSTVTELAGRLRLAQSTVTELVRRAEAVGLIERETSPRDGRVVHLRVTPEGEERLSRTIRELRGEREHLQTSVRKLGRQL
ncbi:MAG TPA: MarR family transcriptional regulator [Gaiellaceae bacterium]|jgi:DNA-binding MarR family transcriptional regulator